MLMSDSSSDEEDFSEELNTSEAETTSSGRQGGAKVEIAKAEGVLRSNSSYIDMDNHHSSMLTKRMKDESLDHSKVLSESKHPITRICLTGGPCAGKTTALATLSTVLRQLGFRVLLVPEAATLLMKGGAMIETRKLTFADAVRFQINVMKMQMSLEDIFIEIALEQEHPTIILCDRGVMDGSAYTSDNIWQAILDETGWSTIQLRDRRYEAVIHLVTAADGAGEFYTTTNNEARYESKEDAQELDKKLINAWVGHPHFSIIDNSSTQGFQKKIDRCLDTVLNFIGLPTPANFYKKFLLITRAGEYEITLPKNVKKEFFQLEETFLIATADQVENFIRKSGKNDSFNYNHEIRFYQNNERIVKKRQISAREYIELFENQRDPSEKQLKKIRQCFIYEQQYFMVETFLNVDGSPSLLRIETTKAGTEIKIPPFLKVLRDVTEDHEYASSVMAKHDYKMPEADKKAILAASKGSTLVGEIQAKAPAAPKENTIEKNS